MSPLRRSLFLLALAAPLVGGANTTVTNTTYSSGQTATVLDPDNVTTSGTVTVSSGANITYQAQTSISLQPGFTAASGSYFHAEIVDLKPVFTSGTSSSGTVASGFNFQVTASGGPTSFSATGLPAGLSINPSTGLISGTPTAAGTFTITVTAANSYGSRTQTITFTVASGITCNGSVSPKAIFSIQAVTLSLDGGAAPGVGVQYAQYTIWRPDGTVSQHVYSTPLGSAQYTPDGGNGVYWMQLRIVDNYGNYADQWVNFFLEPASSPLPYTTSFQASAGYIVDGNLYPQDGWLVQQGIANIVTTQGYDGNASVSLVPGNQAPGALVAQVQKFFTGSQTNAFVDVYAQPVAASSSTSSSWIDNGASRIGFVTVSSSQAAIYAYNGNGSGGGTWTDTGKRFDINASNQSTQWLRLTVDHDYTTHKWQLIVDGVRAGSDLGFVSNPAASLTGITWWGASSAAVYFDAFAATTINPFPAPGAPINLAASNHTDETFLLSWSLPSGSPAATLYEIYQTVNGTTTLAGTSTTTSFTVPGLYPSTTYRMTVRAQNAAGYWSGSSAYVDVVTLADQTPPTKPAGLTVSGLTPVSFTLTWSASYDLVGVAGYEVQLNGTSIGTPTSPSFTVTGLLPSTSYSVRVRARDAIPNWSVLSDLPFDVTTAAPDMNADYDGDGVTTGVELSLGLNPYTDPTDVSVHTFTYDKINQLKRGPGGEYIKDAEGNIEEVIP